MKGRNMNDKNLRLDPRILRTDFPILTTRLANGQPLVYLDNAATSQCPRQVLEAMVDVYSRSYANVHRGIHDLSEKSTELFEAGRERVRRFIHAQSSEEIVFTHGTTESINLVARSWAEANLGAGDEIVVTEMEHHSNIVPWQQAAAKVGAKLRWAPITGDGELDLEAFGRLLGARTRLVAVTGVSNVLGTINPIREITAVAHAARARVLMDGAQWVGHLPTDVRALGVDFLAFSAHKMLGPGGVGVLYAKRELLEQMPPFLGGGGMVSAVTQKGFTPADSPARFEAGTPPIAGVIAFQEALDYLDRVGLESIHQHGCELGAYARRLLTEIPGVRLLGPSSDRQSGIVSFVVDGLHPHDVAHLLNTQGVAVRAGQHCAMPLHQRLGLSATTRASFYLYNTAAEVAALAEALIQVAETITRRRRPLAATA
jgi:cysteine desulfurase/selenocysteine lyase